MKRTKKPLVLRRKTVTELATADLQGVAGGGKPDSGASTDDGHLVGSHQVRMSGACL